MHRIVNDEALDTLFRAARSHYAWLARPVSDTILRALWELVKLAPTGDDAATARIVFVKSPAAKARLGAALAAGGRDAVASAPVAAIVALPADGGRPAAGQRDGALHGAILILAARALGLDCQPVWDFDAAAVAAVCGSEARVEPHFLCALGYGDEMRPAAAAFQRAFDEACVIL